MCGRYILISPPDMIRRAFAYTDQPNFPPRYNVAPTQPVPVVLLDQGARRFQLMRWGLLPAWVKDPRTFSLVINARAETVLDKPNNFDTCIGQLPEHTRNCLTLAFVEGRSHDEIARLTSNPLGSVKSWIRRGLMSLKACLSGEGQTA